MTGKTHRVGGMLCVLGCFSYLESKGMLLKNVDPILQLTVMYPFAIYGSVFPDLDHDISSIPSKDIVSVSINKVLHLTSGLRRKSRDGKIGVLSIFDARHRSWQTHSELSLFLLILGMYQLLHNSIMNSVQSTIVLLVGLGFLLGVISHLILDMLTSEGIWFLSLVAVGKVLKKERVIPKKISIMPSIRVLNKLYRRFIGRVIHRELDLNDIWESLVRRVLWFLCVILFIRLLYLASPYRIIFNF